MAKLTYTNEKGQSLTFGDSAPLLVTKIDGLGSPQNEIYRHKSPYQDGTTTVGSTLGERNLVIEGVILASNRQKYRHELIKTFNPKFKGEIRFERDGVVRKIGCQVEFVDFPSAMQVNYQPFLISLLCDNPFWLDEIETSEEIVTWIGGISFPLQLPTQFATAGPKIINIINSGDVETPIKLEITGKATNPKILKRLTGEFIKVNRTLTADDTLVITTDFGNKRVEQNGVNVFNYIDLNSTFFSLDVGDNVIELITDDVTDNANIKITYRNRYLGV